MLKIYQTLLRTELAVMLQYRAAMLIWLIGLMLQPVIYLVVWITVARSRDGRVGDFDEPALAAYYIVFMVVNHITFDWHMHEMGWRVRSGSFSPLLMQPLHPIHRDLTRNMAYKLLTLAVVAPAAAALAWYFEPAFGTQSWALAAFVPAIILAYLMRFAIEWAVALLAFWVTDTSGLNNLYYVTGMFLTGKVAPLALMPEWVQLAATILPFRWMVAFPVELLLGRVSQAEAMTGLAAQAIWLALALGILSLCWKRAVRSYSAVGA